MLKYVINRLMHSFFHIRTVIIHRPISILGLKPSGRYRSLGMMTVLIWKRACINLLINYLCDIGRKELSIKIGYITSRHCMTQVSEVVNENKLPYTPPLCDIGMKDLSLKIGYIACLKRVTYVFKVS
jgi:hypothetical protein